jgi:hypothetical protein
MDIDELDAKFTALRREDDERNRERITFLEKSTALALSAVREATAKFEATNNERFNKVNEFRQMAVDLIAGFITREAASVRFTSIEDKLDALTARMDKREGQGSGASATISYIALGLTVLIALYELVKAFSGK